MANKGYEVLVDQLTVHRMVGELVDPISGRVVGRQNGQGKTYFLGEVIPADAISPDYTEALEDEDHPAHESLSKKLKPVSADARQNVAQRLGVPFEGYDEMDEDEVLAAMRNLPSPTIQRIKEYESGAGEGRERIVNYSIGFGESPTDRQEGLVSSDLDEDGRDESDKAVARLTTREVPEEGLVQPGEGITGTGDPAIPYGSGQEDEEEKPKARRSRRKRTTSGSGSSSKDDASGEGSGGGSGS